MVRKLSGKAVEIFSDSRLVVGQVKGELEARDYRMQGYLDKARQLQSAFEFFPIQQVLRSNNSLGTLATSLGQVLPRIILIKDLLALAEVDLVRVGVLQIRVGLS